MEIKKRVLSLSILSILYGATFTVTASTPSKNIEKVISDYNKYNELSNDLHDLSIVTPGDGSYPNQAISIIYNGTDTIDFDQNQLKISNIQIIANKAADSKNGFRAGIVSNSNNILGENIQIKSFDTGYYGILNKNNENFDNRRNELSTSNFMLNNSEFNLYGDKSKGIWTYKTSINSDSFAHVGVNESTLNMYGDASIGLQTINATITTDNTEVNLFGKNSIGVSVYNTGNVLIDNQSSINSQSDTATGLLLSRFISPNYWQDDLKDDQKVTIDNNSIINVKNGTGILATAGKDTVNVSNGSSIISKILIDARKATEDYKNHPTTVSLNVTDSSIVNGSVKTEEGAITSVDLASNGVWNITGNSNLTNLVTNNAIVNFAQDNNQYTTTNIKNLSGDNGIYTFSVDVVNQIGSMLIINESSEGNHIAQGLNDGAQDATGKEKITIIIDKSNQNTKATFNPGKDVELGGYAYQVQRDKNNPNEWILSAKNASDQAPKINETARTITGLASTSYLMNQAEMSSLRQRMGDLIKSPEIVSQGERFGTWGRMYAGNYQTSNNNNLAKVDMNYYGFQLGSDINSLHYSENKNYVGIFIGHTTGNPDYIHGDATVTSWYGGFYDTFVADNGFYIDSILKVGQYSNKYTLKDSQSESLHGKTKSNTLTLSSQAGKHIILSESKVYNVYLEPQIQLNWSRIGTFNTTASNGLRVKQDSYNSTVGRVGLMLGTKINSESDIYLKTSYLHEFSKDVKYTLNNSPESYNIKGHGIETGIGANIKLSDNGYLYAEGDYINSKSHYIGSKFNIGYRYNF